MHTRRRRHIPPLQTTRESPELPCRRSLPPACSSLTQASGASIRANGGRRGATRCKISCQILPCTTAAGSRTGKCLYAATFYSPADPILPGAGVTKSLSLRTSSQSPTHSQQMHRPKRLRTQGTSPLAAAFCFSRPAYSNARCRVPELFRSDDDLTARAIPGGGSALLFCGVLPVTTAKARASKRSAPTP